MTPAIARGLPILMRSTFTRVAVPVSMRWATATFGAGPVKGLTLGVAPALVCLEGAELIDCARHRRTRLCAALHAAHISVVMISQSVRAFHLLRVRISAKPMPAPAMPCKTHLPRIGRRAGAGRDAANRDQRAGSGGRWHGRHTRRGGACSMPWRGRGSTFERSRRARPVQYFSGDRLC